MSIRRLPSGKWQARWYDAAGRRVTESFATKRAASAAHARGIDERSRGILSRRRTPLSAFLVDWERSTRARVEPSTWRHAYEPHVRRYIRPALGHLEVGRIDAWQVQRFIDGLAGKTPPLSAATRKRIFATLRIILNKAAAEGYREPLAKDSVSLPEEHTIEFDVPTIAQIELLADVIDPDWRAAVMLGGYCGLRRGEVFGLAPADVDWDKHRIRVRQSLENHTRERKVPKSGKARWVTMPRMVEVALRVHLEEFPAKHGFVFHREGEAVWPSRWSRSVWRPATEAAGLEGLRFHDLRHAAVVIWLQSGWTPKRAQLEAGHSSAAFTLDRYGHVQPDEVEEGRLRLDEALARAVSAAKAKAGAT